MAFDSYYTGYRKSVRQPDELIVAIEIPRIDGAQWWRKVGTRRAQAISKVMIAAVRAAMSASRLDRSRRRSCSRPEAAAVLSGGGSIADAQAALGHDISPIDDLRSTGEYRAKVAANLLAEFWKETS